MILLAQTPVVNSNPPSPGPYLKALGQRLGYPPCNLTEAAEEYARLGTVAGCPADTVYEADVAELDAACAADAPREPRLPLADWIAAQASWFRSQRTAAGDWLAAEVQELADLARALHAATPEQLTDRRSALEQSMRETSFAAFLTQEGGDL